MQKHPYGTIREGKIYLDAFLHFPEREIGEVKESPESTIKYFEERFNAIEKKVAGLEEAIASAENKGSYLMKLLHLKKSLESHDGLGNYIPLFQRLEVLEDELNKLVAQNREKNLEIKRALLEEAKELQNTHDFKAGTEKANELKEKWIKTGSVGKQFEEEIETAFKAIKDDFFMRRKLYYDDKKALTDSRIKKYEEIIEELKKSVDAGNLPETVKTIKQLQERWKTVGEVPSKVNRELWSQFKRLTNPVFAQFKSKRHPHSRGDRNNDSFDKKRQLLEQVKALYQNPSPNVLDSLKRLQFEWKKVSNPSREKRNGLNDEFFLICDKVRELSFVNKVAFAKNKGFHQKPHKEQIKIKIHLLKDLLYRDEKDLALFKENSQKFSSDANSFNHLLNNKLGIQKRKVEIKKLLLTELQGQLLEPTK